MNRKKIRNRKVDLPKIESLILSKKHPVFELFWYMRNFEASRGITTCNCYHKI